MKIYKKIIAQSIILNLLFSCVVNNVKALKLETKFEIRDSFLLECKKDKMTKKMLNFLASDENSPEDKIEYLKLFFKYSDLKANLKPDNNMEEIGEFIEPMIRALLYLKEKNIDIWGKESAYSMPFLNCIKKADKIKIDEQILSDAITCIKKSENLEIIKQFALLLSRTNKCYESLFTEYAIDFLCKDNAKMNQVDNILLKKDLILNNIVNLLNFSNKNKDDFIVSKYIDEKISKIEIKEEDIKTYLAKKNFLDPIKKIEKLRELSNQLRKYKPIEFLINKELEKISNTVSEKDIKNFLNQYKKYKLFYGKFGAMYRLYNYFKNFKIGKTIKEKIEKKLKTKSFDTFPFLMQVIRREISKLPTYYFEQKETLNFERNSYSLIYDSNPAFCPEIDAQDYAIVGGDFDILQAKINKLNAKSAKDKAEIFRLNEIILYFLTSLEEDFKDFFENNKEEQKYLKLCKQDFYDVNFLIMTPDYVPIVMEKEIIRKTHEGEILRKINDMSISAQKINDDALYHFLDANCNFDLYDRLGFATNFINAFEDLIDDKSHNKEELKIRTKELLGLFLKSYKYLLQETTEFPSTENDISLIVNYLKTIDVLEYEYQAQDLNIICDKMSDKKMPAKKLVQSEFQRLALFSKKECQNFHKYKNLARFPGLLYSYYDYFIESCDFGKCCDQQTKKVLELIAFKKVIKESKEGSIYKQVGKCEKIIPNPDKNSYVALLKKYTKSSENPFKKVILLSKLLNDENKEIKEFYEEIIKEIENIEFTSKNVENYIASSTNKIQDLKKIKESFPLEISSVKNSLEKIIQEIESIEKKKYILTEKSDLDKNTLKEVSQFFNYFLKDTSLSEEQTKNVLLNLMHHLILNKADPKPLLNFNFDKINNSHFLLSESNVLKFLLYEGFGDKKQKTTFINLKQNLEKLSPELKLKIKEFSEELFLETFNQTFLEIYLKFEKNDEQKQKLAIKLLEKNKDPKLYDNFKKIFKLDILNISSIMGKLEPETKKIFTNKILMPLLISNPKNELFKIYFEEKELNEKTYDEIYNNSQCTKKTKNIFKNFVKEKILSENKYSKEAILLLLNKEIKSNKDKNDVKFLFEKFLSKEFFNEKENINWAKKVFGSYCYDCNVFSEYSTLFLKEELKDINSLENFNIYLKSLSEKISLNPEKDCQEEYNFVGNFLQDLKKSKKDEIINRNSKLFKNLESVYDFKVNKQNREKLLKIFNIKTEDWDDYKEDSFGNFKKLDYEFSAEEIKKTKAFFTNDKNHLTIGEHTSDYAHNYGFLELGLNLYKKEDRRILYKIVTSGNDKMTTKINEKNNSQNFYIPVDEILKNMSIQVCFDSNHHFLKTIFLVNKEQ